jgi:hypothetical protein
MTTYLWFANFIFAAVIVAPLYFVLQKQFGGSVSGEKLFSGMDIPALGDLIYSFRNILPALVGWLLGPAALYLLARVFLNGGVIGRLAAGPERVTLQGFSGDGGRYFGRLFRVVVLSLVGYFLVFGLLGQLVSAPFKLWMKGASTQWTTLSASFLRLLVFLLLFSAVKMFFDYVKVSLVLQDNRGALRATIRMLGFVGRRFFKAWALFLLVGLLFLAITAIYLAVGNSLPRAGTAWAVGFFLWQQAYIFAISWVSVLLFSTECHFFKAHQVVSS